MTAKSLYEYSHYKPYLTAKLGGQGKRTGARARLAAHLNCHTAYVSQVLNAAAHISLEQAAKVNQFFEHGLDEARFFILLVLKDRAGSKDLEKHFENELNEIRSRRQQIKNRITSTKEIPDDAKSKYYSHWLYAAVHAALMVLDFRTREELAVKLHVDTGTLQKVLDFLTEIGLSLTRGEHYEVGPSFLHLSHESENIIRHHTNWRLQALKSLDRVNEDELHYSALLALSREDVAKIKNHIIELIAQNLKTIESSKEQVVYCTSFDLFRVAF